MPTRKIIFPSPVTLRDPADGSVLTGPPVTMGDFVKKLFANPIWNESYKAARAQDSIGRAIDNAVIAKDGSFSVAEEDWQYLKAAAENPRMVVFVQGGGSQTIAGFGALPSMARQFVVFQTAIIDAIVE